MRGMWQVVVNILLTVCCWGVYGPVLHHGQLALGSRLLPLICVGLSYFLIAVLVPLAALKLFGEAGVWNKPGTLWSLAAGAAGAIGALGIIMAFTYRGSPIYVMALVFGGAPVVNTMLTMFMSRTYKDVGPKFFGGLLMVVVGAVMVLLFKPAAGKAGAAPLTGVETAFVAFFVAATALAWGVYGPVLHKGQAAMSGSKLRPLICVGISYFVIAVVVPGVLLTMRPEEISNVPAAAWTPGISWSLAAGAAGAFGALGIIMAFNFGGKPVYVMPLVFGGAPVVNAFTEILDKNLLGQTSPVFYAALVLVAAGAVTVLVFAPRPGKKPTPPVGAAQPA